MDNFDFSNFISSWLDPFVIYEMATQYQKNPHVTDKMTALAFVNTQLNSGEEANFSKLLTEYLDHFRIPKGVINIVTTIFDTSEWKGSTIKWLKNLRFTGKIEPFGKNDKISHLHPDTILILRERELIADILLHPTQALLNLVQLLQYTWKKASIELPPNTKDGEGVYLSHSSHSPSLVYLEQQVAKFYGYEKQGLIFHSKAQGIKMRYRSVTAFGNPVIDKIDLEVAAKSAESQAKSTNEPIQINGEK